LRIDLAVKVQVALRRNDRRLPFLPKAEQGDKCHVVSLEMQKAPTWEASEGVMEFFLALIIKPLLLVVFVFLMACGVYAVKRFAPPFMQRVLLRKLW
jgi:hypothetical protein